MPVTNTFLLYFRIEGNVLQTEAKKKKVRIVNNRMTSRNGD